MANKQDRYYYTKNGSPAYSIKEPIESLLGKDSAKDYVEVTQEEWAELTKQTGPTSEQLAIEEKKNQIASLKAELAKTDYQCLKFLEGWISEEDYAEIKAHRQSLRDQINELEAEL